MRIVPDASRVRRRDEARYHGSREGLIARLSGGEVDTNRAAPAQPVEPAATAGPLRAVIYLRVSTEEQARVGGTAEGYSIPYQRRACQEKAEQVGAAVVAEYVDLGESAKSARRPELQRMLRELVGLGVRVVIVHKIDRLARNTRDDYEINGAIAAAGARLVSVSEHIDDTPAGRLNHVIQAGVAQYYSDNLRFEVIKGLTTKVQTGGTPYRAPTGYLNRQESRDNIIIRSIEVDPERAPLVRWAFEAYSHGDWTVRTLLEALTEKGLRTRATPKRPAKPLSINGLHGLLRNPYYTGVVPYLGAYHDGTHPPLVDTETWLRVQAVLAAHNTAGEKDRKHPHYLKGSIWCGGCGGRLIFSRNTGNGGSYDYFFCLNRRQKRQPCRRRAVRVKAVESGVEDFYRRFQLDPDRAESIRAAVSAELRVESEIAAMDKQRANQQLTALTNERKAVLQAHYAGAIPLDLLREEMERLTREMSEAEGLARTAMATVEQLESTLHAALTVATHCHQHYQQAPPHLRRQINQGFFTKLYIDTDGTVERTELTEPFASLLRISAQVTPAVAEGDPGTSAASEAVSAAPDTPGRARRSLGAKDNSPTIGGLVGLFDDLDTSGDDLVAAGVNKVGLVPAAGFEPALSPP
ncbi:MAG: recombinase family protein [Pseudonocardia sp.]